MGQKHGTNSEDLEAKTERLAQSADMADQFDDDDQGDDEDETEVNDEDTEEEDPVDVHAEVHSDGDNDKKAEQGKDDEE